MTPKRFSVWRIALIGLALLFVIYAAAGFFFLPSFLKSKLQEEITAGTGMKTTIGAVRVNPFALSVTLEDCSLADKDNDSFFALKRFYVNFETRSIFTGAATFSEIALDSPFVHLKIYPGGTTNIPSFAKADTAHPASPPDSTAARFYVLIDRFALTRGRTIYEDRSHGTPRITRFDSLNLTLNDFTTRPKEQGGYAFDASTDRGEKISWRGMFQAAPVMSSGTIALSGFKARTLWEFMQDKVNYELTDGELSAHAEYRLDLSRREALFTLQKGGLSVAGFRLIDNETKTEQISISNASIAPIDLDYGARSIHIGTASSTHALVHTTRDLKGDLGISALLTMKPDPEPSKGPPWKIGFDKIQLNDYSVEIADLNTDPATELVLSPVAVTIEHYTVLSSKPASIVVRGAMKPSGTFSVNGTFTDEPVTSVITVSCSGIQLPLFQRFVDKSANLKIESGALAVNGKLRYAAAAPARAAFAQTRSASRARADAAPARTTAAQTRADAAPAGAAGTRAAAGAARAVPIMDFDGSASVSSFRATDPLVNKDFLRWKSLDLRRIAFTQTPARLDIGEIIAHEAYIRFIIDSTRTSNIQKIMAVGPAADSTLRRDSLAAPDSAARAQARTRTRIGLIRIVDGSMNFADFSLSPNFVTGIHELNGDIVGLNSEQMTHAEMSLDGKVDRYAPVEIRGQINPLSEEVYTDITMKFVNIELTTFTPYFGKFAGYKIDKGKLSLDLHYKLNKQFLEAENTIVVDQLTLGEKVEGPDVTSLPVRLAVALLKDSKGVIDLDLPLKGSLNDPEFSIFPIVVKVLVNLVMKAVSSPFKLLGSLLGDNSDDLSNVQFRPGVDTLDTAEQSKLATLAKAMNERPGLRLDVRGLVCDSLDRRAIAESKLVKQIRLKGGSGRALTDADNERILELYSERFHSDPDSLLPERKEGGAEMSDDERQTAIVGLARQRIMLMLQPDDDALLGLARRRATAVKDQLVFRSGIEEGRIFLLDFQKGAKDTDGLVQMPLALDAR